MFKSLNEIYPNFIFEGNSNIEKANDSTYIVTNSDGEFKYTYGKSDYNSTYTTNVVRERVTEDYEDEYTTLFSFYFNGNSEPVEYKIKRVSGYSNDFTYASNGVRYKILVSNGLHNNREIDFLPVDYMMSKDKTYCYVLCHKISKDGVVSNKYYSFKLTNNLKMSKMTDNIAIFEKNGYVYFNKSYKKLLFQ